MPSVSTTASAKIRLSQSQIASTICLSQSASPCRRRLSSHVSIDGGPI
jgi:hypothetical protein